ncbi:MAG: hypothetical protein ACOYMR_04645 [Ilumatobacteraceae bacterium]
MWPHEEALADEPIVVRGSSIEEAARTAQDLIGRPVKVVKADRIRRGGIAGFFATDLGVEVTVVPVSNVPYDTPAVSFAEAFERLMADAATGDRHSVASAPPPAAETPRDEASSLLTTPLPIPAPLVVRSRLERAPSDDESIDEFADPHETPADLRAGATWPAAAVMPVSEPLPTVPTAWTAPAADAPAAADAVVTAAVAPAPPAPVVMAAPAAPVALAPPIAAAPVDLALPVPVVAPAAPAPVLLTADHGRMARDVAEAMISHLGEHGTVSVSVRIALADGSELRADARAGNRS